MSNQLVSNLTVDELKEVIASVVDNRLDNLLRSLNTDFAIKSSELNFVHNLNIDLSAIVQSVNNLANSKSEPKEDEPWLKSESNFAHNPNIELSAIVQSVNNLANSKSEPKEDNPWLRIAGMHKHNPLFEEVAVSIQANHQEYPDEELS